ncbi:hypothetical protein J6590_003758 [Homalodisca vitripennis]|nr:hypothetical protein J6590_003758 [Homalodisca vitripennis]
MRAIYIGFNVPISGRDITATLDLSDSCLAVVEDAEFTFLLLQNLESDAVPDLTPGIWSHVRLERSKHVSDEEVLNELLISFRNQGHLVYNIIMYRNGGLTIF